MSKRYQVNGKRPSVIILDQNGYVQYDTDGTSGCLQKVDAALSALTDK